MSEENGAIIIPVYTNLNSRHSSYTSHSSRISYTSHGDIYGRGGALWTKESQLRSRRNLHQYYNEVSFRPPIIRSSDSLFFEKLSLQMHCMKNNTLLETFYIFILHLFLTSTEKSKIDSKLIYQMIIQNKIIVLLNENFFFRIC